MSGKSDIIFLDLEASGLGAASWPIEVGWCGLKDRPQTMLIRPDEGWPETAWDPAAEKLHGISQHKLVRAGRPAAEVCEKLNAALAGKAVYSDAPDWDGFWLYRLFAAARARQHFEMLDFGDLLVGVAPERILDAKAIAQKKAPHKHRARDDVLHMRMLYDLTVAASRD